MAVRDVMNRLPDRPAARPILGIELLISKVLDRGRIDSDGKPDDVITDAMLERVFGVGNAAGLVPPRDQPFVLPHAAHKVQRGR